MIKAKASTPVILAGFLTDELKSDDARVKNPYPQIRNTGTIAPLLLLRDGFSAGYAKESIEGSIKTGMEISIDIWRQLFFLLLKISKQNRISPMKNSAAEKTSSAGRFGIELTQMTPLLKKNMVKDFHKLCRKIKSIGPLIGFSNDVSRDASR